MCNGEYETDFITYFLSVAKYYKSEKIKLCLVVF